MKKTLIFILFFSLLSCGLGVERGQGKFNGRIVDVSWEGMLFPSCEVEFQLGEQSSSLSKGSSLDKELCKRLQARIGEVVTVNYSERSFSGCGISTSYVITESDDE